jgi:hypothetical protein
MLVASMATSREDISTPFASLGRVLEVFWDRRLHGETETDAVNKMSDIRNLRSINAALEGA